jgi:hypothetical protein
MIAIIALALRTPVSGSAKAGSQKEMKNFVKVAARELSGCGTLIGPKGLDERSRAIAYSRRSDAQLASSKID